MRQVQPVTQPASLAQLAVRALLDELQLAPKPALVDPRGSGAHQDMSFALMERSAHSLLPCFEAISIAAREIAEVNLHLRETLGAIGRDGEAQMLSATCGINTHRGAIWALGLLLAAAELNPGADAAIITDCAAAIARLPDRFAPTSGSSHGARACQRYQVGGARAQAIHGFPEVQAALIELRYKRGLGVCEIQARLDALMRIMLTLEDTCVLHRAGPPGLLAMHSGAEAVLAAGGSGTLAGRRALHFLDARLTHLNASPGGAADVLAAALFVEHLSRRSSTCTP